MVIQFTDFLDETNSTSEDFTSWLIEAGISKVMRINPVLDGCVVGVVPKAETGVVNVVDEFAEKLIIRNGHFNVSVMPHVRFGCLVPDVSAVVVIFLALNSCCK